MVYCTLQEAWGVDFPKKKKRKKTPKNDTNIEHFVSTNDKLSKNRYRYDFSRDDKPLPQHNGNENRIQIEDNYEIKNDYDEQNLEDIKEEVMEELEEQTQDITKETDVEEYYTDPILSKLNELITKLDNNQGNSMNDIILFILLGIFIIFILDTFVRIGKLSNSS